MARSLVDTNILVYAHDLKEAIKRPRAVSEDFQHGREIEGVVFVNPFREA